METYNIDDDMAFNDFISFLREEKPDKEIDGDIITLPDFKVKIFPQYQDKLKDLFEQEYSSSEFGNKSTGEIVNQGYVFKTF